MLILSLHTQNSASYTTYLKFGDESYALSSTFHCYCKGDVFHLTKFHSSVFEIRTAEATCTTRLFTVILQELHTALLNFLL